MDSTNLSNSGAQSFKVYRTHCLWKVPCHRLNDGTDLTAECNGKSVYSLTNSLKVTRMDHSWAF